VLRVIKYLLIVLSVAVFSQNIATIDYHLKTPCYKFSIVRSSVTMEDDRFITEKENYSKTGKFEVKTSEKFPLPYYFVCESENRFLKASRLFTVASGDRLNFDMDSIANGKQFFPDTHRQTSLQQDQREFYNAFPDTENLYSPNDEIYRANLIRNISSFEKYAKEHPDSYMLFWNLVNYFNENSWLTGFNKSYLNAFNSLSSSIRNSKYGKAFYQKMVNSTIIKEGSRLPQLKLEGEKKFSLGTSYTLIDFWASYCKPCLEAFPMYKELYKQYKNRGFEIVGISGDRQQDVDKWKKMIQHKQLSWQQYIDIGGKEGEKYNITAYPTTFLLDSEGIIVKKDISLEELEVFLNQHLK
jgi:thiol-disulfide isomerase/thioredoxin